MWFRNTVFIFLLFFILVSCNKGSVRIPNSTGAGSEIIVVTKDAIWDGAIGDTIRSLFAQHMEGLLEAEPEFKLIFIPEQNFNKTLQTHHNILFIEINTNLKKSKVETLKNTWSHPQRVVKIKANSDTACFNITAKHASAIRELFNQSERARYSAIDAINRNTAVEKILSREFGIKMIVSKEFNIAKKTGDFLWLRSENIDTNFGLMIYILPFMDTSQISPSAVLDLRDRLTKQYIPGPADRTFITLDRESTPPISQKIIFKNMYALETRGWWYTNGNVMGGPFINYTVVDAPRHRIVVFDGFACYPNKSNRDFIRQLESIIWGAQFVEPSKNN